MENIIQLFSKLRLALEKGFDPNFVLKPKQIICFEQLINGNDTLAVLPTGYGKSILYQLLPFVMPLQKKRNIVIVVSPLNAIIEDQQKILSQRGVEVATLTYEREECTEDLFAHLNTEDPVEPNFKVSHEIKNGDIDFLFGHPEAFLSHTGRNLLKSKIYQDNVVACVVDEAHCVELWGLEFRKSFQDLVVLNTIFQDRPMLALTATAGDKMIFKIIKDLSLQNCKIVKASPNRRNVFLSVKKRLPNNYGVKSYEQILLPIATKLNETRQDYPITIIYMGLKYCGYAYKLFDMVIENPFCENEITPRAKLYAQFHASTTSCMKEDILEELKSLNSRIRVVFATTAFGMGVNVPQVTNIIHISPPSKLESYIQEIGRAGRNGAQSNAILYYNNSDISKNNLKMDESIKKYCQETDCLRKSLLKYFSFKCETQDNCCENCNPTTTEDFSPVHHIQMSDIDRESIRLELEMINVEKEEDSHLLTFEFNLTHDVIGKISNNFHLITCERDLLHKFDVWDERYLTKIFDVIRKYLNL
ncbi:uncharacterized protein LOC130625010 [Hydractinia symbiolongicarpus]|uniref:uncharacterized protein LOC130625010 n=1 Tax=Hydractinia symbiolongicarpus TaxID=13093 RepID=UPI00254DF708|nr:uncharacterized protein LOC130625010 [Hydractinia symbiolongicarpus]